MEQLSSQLVSFFPTSQYKSRVSFMELQMAESLLLRFRSAVKFAFPNHKIVIDVIMGLLECHSIWRNECTQAENFFGLRRKKMNLVRKLATFSEFFLLDKLQSDKNWNFVRSVFALLYIANISSYSSPIHFLFGIKIARSGEKKSSILNLFGGILVFLVQLFQWYFANESALVPKKSCIVAPPKISGVVPADPRRCGFCFGVRKNPTAILATGQVFCYTCATKFVQNHRLDLRRLV